MVVLHHARATRPWLFNPLEKYNAFSSGVDVFFVISGFVMYFAARNESYFDFLRKRIIRIAPLYWVATFALFAINTNFHIWWMWMDAKVLSHLVKSLLFIPHFNLYNPDQVWPYLGPGWTLNYEMLFYFIFFVGLIFRRILLVCTVAIIALCCLGFFIESKGAILHVYTDPNLLEFLFGVWIAYAYTRGFFNKYSTVFLPLGFFGLLFLPFIGAPDPAGRILCSSMLIIGAVSLGKNTRHNYLLNLLGDASYSIYLTHTFISLRLAESLWVRIPVEGGLQFAGWVVLTVFISSVVGVAVHLFFEKPVLRWLRTKWKGP